MMMAYYVFFAIIPNLASEVGDALNPQQNSQRTLVVTAVVSK